MTTGDSIVGQPAGWYKDPAPRNPAAPDSVRFWDGTNWTAQTRIASKRERQEWAAAAIAAQVAYEQEIVQRAQAGDAEAQQILAAAAATDGSRWTTPDGARLAGWWIRVAAYLIDGIVLGIVGSLMSWRFINQITDAYRQFFDDSMAAARAGAPAPATTTLVDQTAGAFMWIGVTFLIVGFVYEVGFLKGFQATPGKLLLGLQVRLREAPGPLSWRTLLLRWVGKSGVGVLQLIPFGPVLSGLYSLLNYLWPLWDPRRQALHDKLAATNVVRRS